MHFYTLGKHFEDKDYATSFDYYHRGNELRRQQLGLPTYCLHGWHCKAVMTPSCLLSILAAVVTMRIQFLLSACRGRAQPVEQILANPGGWYPELPNISIAFKLDGRRRCLITNTPTAWLTLISKTKKFGNNFWPIHIHRGNA